MTKPEGAIPAPYDETTIASPTLGVTIAEMERLEEWQYCPTEYRAAMFYFFNLSLRNTPPGSWSLFPNTIASLVGVPVDVVAIFFRGWNRASDDRFYHPAIVEIVRKNLAEREKNRERVARHREKGTRKRKPIENDRRSKIPYKDIIGLYNEILPNNPECLELDNTRRTRIRTLWNGELSDLDRWRSFFSYVATLPFLTGQESSKGKKPFRPNIGWLLKPENYLKIKERGYE
jgi:uncharacterized membrane protein